MNLSPWISIKIDAGVPYSKQDAIYLVNSLNTSPYTGGDTAKAMLAADVFSHLPEACDMIGLAKINTMLKVYLTYSLTVCT